MVGSKSMLMKVSIERLFGSFGRRLRIWNQISDQTIQTRDTSLLAHSEFGGSFSLLHTVQRLPSLLQKLIVCKKKELKTKNVVNLLSVLCTNNVRT